MRGRGPAVVYWLGGGLYVNLTNRCSNRCYFCVRNFAAGVGGFNLRLTAEPSVGQVIEGLQRVIHRRRWGEVVFCGFGEPTERLDCVLEVTRWTKRYAGTPVRLDTNGHGRLLNPGRDMVRELRLAGVDRVSVSLNAHDEETYNRVCRPGLRDAYQGALGFAEEAGREMETEVTAVTIPEVDLRAVEEIARRMGVGFRVRRYQHVYA